MSLSSRSIDDQSATLRTLRALVVLLAISNVLIGGISVYLLQKVDDRYSRLVNRAVPALNDLRELVGETVIAVRLTNPSFFAGDAPMHPATIDAIHRAHQKVMDLRAGILAGRELDDEPEARDEVRKTGAAFDAVMRDVSATYASGELDEGLRIRVERLIPAFDQHLAAISTAADATERTSLGSSKKFSDSTASLSTLMLSVASWPVVLLALLALAALLFIAMLTASFHDPRCEDP